MRKFFLALIALAFATCLYGCPAKPGTPGGDKASGSYMGQRL